MANLFVILQFSGVIFQIFCAWRFGMSNHPIIGGPVILLGAATILFAGAKNRPSNFSVHPTPKRNAVLIQTGPYKYVRHPMYTGLLLMSLGLLIISFSWPAMCGFLAILFALIGKMRIEESALLKKFKNYQSYKQKTKLVIPFII